MLSGKEDHAAPAHGVSGAPGDCKGPRAVAKSNWVTGPGYRPAHTMVPDEPLVVPGATALESPVV